ncbi:hypothetical protein JCM33774_54530 [Actinophytocola sp. KF-1]
MPGAHAVTVAGAATPVESAEAAPAPNAVTAVRAAAATPTAAARRMRTAGMCAPVPGGFPTLTVCDRTSTSAGDSVAHAHTAKQ